MKKISTLFAAAMLALAAQAQEGVTYQVKTLTFEDNDYPQDAPNYLGKTTWSSLIDSPQYGGELLYGENHGDTSKVSTDVNYKWYDKGNTNLYSELPTNWNTKMYWGGGHAISNYWNGNLSDGDYAHQLSVYVADETGSGQDGHGHNGSNNFCVHYGYKDNSGYSASNLPAIEFKDGVARVIEGMYINNTTYFVNAITNGNGLTTSLGDNDYVNVVAKGYKSDGTVDSLQTYLAYGQGYFIKDWTYWDLSNLGAVNKIEFNITGTSENKYGFSQPAYFCYDDVAVQMPIANSTRVASPLSTLASETNEKSFIVYNPTTNNGLTLDANAPEGTSVTFDGDGVFAANETETLTLTGMPSNVKVNKIEVTYRLEDILKGDIEISAYVGEVNIGSIFSIGFQSPNKGTKPNQVFHTATVLTNNLKLTAAAANPNTGDFIFKATSISGDKRAGINKCKIYYEIADPTGITNVNTTDNVTEVARFSADGKIISAPQKGINIVRMSDGTTRKVVVE